jgi:hypothetical protein
VKCELPVHMLGRPLTLVHRRAAIRFNQGNAPSSQELSVYPSRIFDTTGAGRFTGPNIFK